VAENANMPSARTTNVKKRFFNVATTPDGMIADSRGCRLLLLLLLLLVMVVVVMVIFHHSNRAC